MKIVFASGNVGKLKEMTELMRDLPVELIAQNHFNIKEIPETGKTFIENAILKARHACDQTGLPAIADDSGLIVPVLNGEPGIYSSRYAGEEGNAQKNISKLLTTLKNHTDRSAFFYCAMVFMTHANDPCPLIGEGKWEGEITLQPKGTFGFGYDPIFFDKTEHCTSAELPLHKKNHISHRFQATLSLLQKLRRTW